MGEANFIVRLLFKSDASQAVQNSTASIDKLGSSIGGLVSKFSSIKGIGTAVLGGLGLVTLAEGFKKILDRESELVEKAKELRDVSEQTGASKDLIQRLTNLTGEPEKAVKTFGFLAQAIEKVNKGADKTFETSRAFAALGVSLKSVATADVDKIFGDIAEAIQGGGDMTTAKISAIKEILGKSGQSLIPALKKGFDSDAATNPGILSDDDQAKLIAGDKLSKQASAPFRRIVDEIAIGVGENLTEAKRQISEGLGLKSKKENDIERAAAANGGGLPEDSDESVRRKKFQDAIARRTKKAKEELDAKELDDSDQFGDAFESYYNDQKRGKSGAKSVQSDSLAKIGLFVGGRGADDKPVILLQKQVDKLGSIVDLMNKLVDSQTEDAF